MTDQLPPLALSRPILANAIRALSMDAVQKANSGHPGMPMGMADIAQVLWQDFLKHNPHNPHWFNRDRFVLSNGHGAMLHYSLLHLTGYALTIEDIKSFRQLGSKTPGHPEIGETPGIETTTGPLAQGLANAVGMALAEQLLANSFNQPDLKLVDHFTYVFLGDGCLMEGLSHEVCALAGTLGLGKLIAFWDDNGISIDGEVAGWFTDNTPLRFKSYDWHVIEVDGHNPEAISQAIIDAQNVKDKPSLICCKTIIGFGAPNLAGTHKVHGAALGEKEVAAAREYLNWPYPAFEIPCEIYSAWDAREKGVHQEHAWDLLWHTYQEKHPALAQEFLRRMQNRLPEDFETIVSDLLLKAQQTGQNRASRASSYEVLKQLGPLFPELIGGSADLTESNLTAWPGSVVVSKKGLAEHQVGNYIHYGVREFGMGGIMNGLRLHSGFIPYGGTFLTFLDYMRSSVRMAALMRQQVIFIFSHDSIGLGEDGPTHQPIEHITLLRSTPNVHVWRPCDDTETVAAWSSALRYQTGPTSLLLSRQSLVHQQRDEQTVSQIQKGGYILQECQGEPDLILLATGSEVDICCKAAKELANHIAVRVVSMPCFEVFNAQTQAYQESVLPPHVKKRMAIEAGHSMSWHKYLGEQGIMIGIEHFGVSAPAPVLFQEYGFTVDNIIKQIREHYL